MKFDLNADRQLAPNELRNLFVVLVSQQQQQQQQFNTIRSQAGSGAARNLSVGSATNSPGGNSGTSGSVPIQGLAVQQAIPIFLRLALQFDANHDGQLNSAELTQLATALLQNNLSMLGAAQSGGQSGSTGGGVTVATGQSQNGARFSGGSIPNQSQFQQQSVQIQLGSGTSGGTETREPRSGNQGRSPQASGRNGGSETGRSRR
ncbi:MAG: hypothetical protein R3C49_16565 [Planctomycetaceae bacterium]